MNMAHGVSAVEKSLNGKTGPCSATYVSQKSCDPSCPWYTEICYASHGPTGWTTNRINKQAKHERLSIDSLATLEAEAIDCLTGKRPCRLHVVGDCRTNRTAKRVSSAAKRYRAKHGKPVWTYTHSWRNVARASWQNVSVLASCETLAHVKQAMKRGYAAAIVVAEHKSKMAYKVDGILHIPCPQQTGASENCLSCGLCFNDKALLARKAVIDFEPDRGTTESIQQKLVTIGGMNHA
jgi:hypothetical protein